MKHNLSKLLLPFAFCFLNTHSFAQKILWEKSYGGKHADYLMDVKPTPDYGFILAGSSLSKKSGNKTEDNNGDLDYWIWKMNEEGELDWQKNFGGSANDLLNCICLTNDGGFILGGTSTSINDFDKKSLPNGQDDFWIIKLDAAGNEQWQKAIGGEWQDDLKTISQTKDGGYIVGGTSASNKSGDKSENSSGGLDYWILKLNSKGEIEWQKSYGGTNDDVLRNIEPTYEGGYIVAGFSNSPLSGTKSQDNNGINDYWILKLNLKGEIEWQSTIGGSKDDQLYVVHQTYDKGYILGGSSNSVADFSKTKSNQSETDFWIVKLKENGEISWQETYNFGKVDILNSLIINDDHTFLLGGYAKGEFDYKKNGLNKAVKGTDDYIALKISENGEELWSKIVGSDGEDILNKVIETRDGGYLMAGTSNPQKASTIANNNSSSSNGSPMLSGMGGENEQFNKAKSEVNAKINETTDSINKEINNYNTNTSNQVKDAIGLKEDSPLKLGGGELGNALNAPSLGDGNNTNGKGASAPQKKLPPSGDKKNNYGSNDFWVVKVKDENKKEKPKLTIEAAPNPTLGYTNVIIGYDFETGTATVVDLSGRIIQKIEITSRTVPIDLSRQPEGIYIVNIKTNVQSDGIKIIKGINKN